MRAFLSLIILNTVAIAACVYSWRLGYAVPLFQSWLSFGILGLFGFGLLSTLWRASRIGRKGEVVMIDHIHQLSDWLVYLGLIGVTIGLMESKDADAAHALAAVLPPALLGFIFALWTNVNFTILDAADRMEDEK